VNAKLIIQARIDELDSELSSLVKELEAKRSTMSDPSAAEPVQDIVAFIQSKTLQVHGYRSAIAELKNVKELV